MHELRYCPNLLENISQNSHWKPNDALQARRAPARYVFLLCKVATHAGA
jgi:hypothetical protein